VLQKAECISGREGGGEGCITVVVPSRNKHALYLHEYMLQLFSTTAEDATTNTGNRLLLAEVI
jgi:hypothetical protein